MSIPADITVRPLPKEEPIFGVCTPGDCKTGSRDDVASAANPLHYVPFVSQVYEAATGDTGSAALKVVGGAVLGGPIGLIAGIASAIFEQATGDSIGHTIASAFSDDEAPTQVAHAAQAYSARAESVETIVPKQEILPPEKTAALSSAGAVARAQETQMKLASAITDIGNPASTDDTAVLSLFGGQAPSAHRSYQKAQMLSYLQDVNHSMVM